MGNEAGTVEQAGKTLQGDWREKYRVQATRRGLKNARGPGDTVFPGKFRRKVEWAEYKCKDRPRQHNSPSGSKHRPFTYKAFTLNSGKCGRPRLPIETRFRSCCSIAAIAQSKGACHSRS